MQDIKLGPFDGITAVLVIVACIIAAACLVAVFVVNIIKAIKEHFDDKEDKAEDEFFAEYGVTGEELRLNQKIAQKRNELMSLMHNRKARRASMAQESEPDASPETQEPVEETPIEPAPVEEPIAPAAEPAPIEFAPKEEVKEEPIPEPVKEEPIPEPAPEPVKEEVKQEPVVQPEPIKEEVKEEPKPEPISEPVKEEVKPEPIVEPAPVEPAPVEEPKKQGVAKPAAKKVVKKKPDDWSKYDGTYEGYYYDPEDACYYEGTPSPALAKKLAAKEAELEALNANKDKKVVIKKVAPPFAALKTPKNKRQAPKPVAGFDESVIYGKYVMNTWIRATERKSGSTPSTTQAETISTRVPTTRLKSTAREQSTASNLTLSSALTRSKPQTANSSSCLSVKHTSIRARLKTPSKMQTAI